MGIVRWSRLLETDLPATYSIDPDQRLVISRIWGTVTNDEVHEQNRRLRTDARFDPHASLSLCRIFAIHAESLGQVITVLRERTAAEACLGLND